MALKAVLKRYKVKLLNDIINNYNYVIFIQSDSSISSLYDFRGELMSNYKIFSIIIGNGVVKKSYKYNNKLDMFVYSREFRSLFSGVTILFYSNLNFYSIILNKLKNYELNYLKANEIIKPVEKVKKFRNIEIDKKIEIEKLELSIVSLKFNNYVMDMLTLNKLYKCFTTDLLIIKQIFFGLLYGQLYYNFYKLLLRYMYLVIVIQCRHIINY